MKVNPFLTFISIALAGLFGYLVFNIAEGKEHDNIFGIISSVCFIATLIPTIGIQYESSRLGANIRVFSVLFFVIFIICHICFAIFGIVSPYCIIVNGILLIVYFAILYKLNSIKNI